VSESKQLARFSRLESWLRTVIRVFQNAESRPDLEFDNLADLSSPTQMYGIAIREHDFYRVSILITHLGSLRNGQVMVVRMEGLQELAKFASQADEVFRTGDLTYEYRELLAAKWVEPERGVGESQCISLANWTRSEVMLYPPAVGAAAGSRSIVQTLPPGAAWRLTSRGRLQDPVAFLESLGTAKQVPSPSTEKSTEEETPIHTAAPKLIAWGAYNEPLVWFGKPPFPSASDLILGRPTFFHHDERFVAKGRLGEFETYVYGSGLSVAVTPDKAAARSHLNQFFAALSRSGIPALTLPDSELVEITDFDIETGAIRGSHMAVTRRNRLGGIPSDYNTMEFSFVVEESTAQRALAIADTCATDPKFKELSLRYFDASSLNYGESFTEAFVVAWSLIECYLQSAFNAIWGSVGYSNSRIKEMAGDWTASHGIDLLVAVVRLSLDEAKELHGLRKLRNKIVHDLRDATQEDATRCLSKAADLLQLPCLTDIDVKLARF